MLEQPTSVPHTLLHTSGTTQPTSSAGGRTSTQTQNQPTANTFARTVSTAELLYELLYCFFHYCFCQPCIKWTSVSHRPGQRTLLIMPGNTMRNIGSSFRQPHMMQPAFTWVRLRAARHRWTITWRITRQHGLFCERYLYYIFVVLYKEQGEEIQWRLVGSSGSVCEKIPTGFHQCFKQMIFTKVVHGCDEGRMAKVAPGHQIYLSRV